MHGETHRLRVRRYKVAHGRSPGRKALQQLNGLEELKAIGLPAKMGLHRIGYYSKILCPALGGHSFNTPFRCWVLASSWLKLFMETYRPKKFSITCANRYTPPPTN
jgi:hypothetical protein